MSLFKVSTGIPNIGLKLTDGRKHFWQWDAGCKLTAMGIPEGNELHFYRDGMDAPLTLEVYRSKSGLVCDVPDELLQVDEEFTVYANIIGENGNHTILEKTFVVKKRPKPSGYVYTPTEAKDYKDLEAKLQEVYDLFNSYCEEINALLEEILNGEGTTDG